MIGSFARCAGHSEGIKGPTQTLSPTTDTFNMARLHNPEHSYNNLKILINASTLPNMFDLCPPFQIDGNLGGPAAISEMLIQSTADEITVLPALPYEWPSGSLKGVRVRGGGKVDIKWKVGKLTELRVRCDRAVKYLSRMAARTLTFEFDVARQSRWTGVFTESRTHHQIAGSLPSSSAVGVCLRCNFSTGSR